MELYILDDLFRRDSVVDKFESLIWTERFSAAGDFEITLTSTPDNRATFPTGTKITHNETYRVATVSSIEDATDAEGRSILTVKGFTLESILEDRLAKYTKSGTNAEPKWTITDKPADIARAIFYRICRDGLLDVQDKIPFYTAGNLFLTDTISEPTAVITYDVDPKSVYSAVKDICDTYDLGFRLYRGLDTTQLYFNIYAGCDRTTKQSSLPPVVFAPEFDNLQNTSALTTTVDYKNVAYVISPVGFEIVYPDAVDPDTDGFERRVLIVQADDITDSVPATATARMIQRGKEQLSQHRQVTAFDGEINQNSTYKYGRDYQLGDLVEIRNADGLVNNMQVTEQIFVSDHQGERSYPTLSLNQFITPGSWIAWDFNQVWFDLDSNTTLTWSTA